MGVVLARCCQHVDSPVEAAARLLSGAGAGALSVVVNSRCGEPTPVLHGRDQQRREWVVADQSRITGRESIRHLREFPVTLGIVEQAPVADLRVTIASLVARGTARVVPPGRQRSVDFGGPGQSRCVDLLAGWPEGRLYALTVRHLTVQGAYGRVHIDPEATRLIEPDPFALDQLLAVEALTVAHEEVIVDLAERVEATAAAAAGVTYRQPDQLRLIGLDSRGATALSVRGSVGTRVRLAFSRTVTTVEEAVTELRQLARASR